MSNHSIGASGTILTSPVMFKTDSQSQQEPWNIISQVMHFRSKDAQFWWNRTGYMFSKLLKRAGYSHTEQYRELNFFALFVVPELGPAPDEDGNTVRWSSPSTPDYTPIDFSWEWTSGSKATVRFTFEPIGFLAGTPKDPFNRKATRQWITKLQEQQLVPNLDLQYYNHFAHHMLPKGSDLSREAKEGFIEETTPNAGTYVARDLEPTGPVIKVYLYPGLKAKQVGITNLQIVQQAIRSLPAESYQSLNVEPLLEYLEEGTARFGFETGIVGIDCVAPQDARIKIYVRAPHTSVSYLMDALTLGGRRKLSDSGEALEDLKDLWNTFLGDSPDILPEGTPGRANPGFYYTVSSGKEVSPKMYLSPSHFCSSDADFLARLRRYFSTRRSDNMIDNYEQAMNEIFDKETLESRCGSHYYIGCALHKNKLRIVTYLSPQTFDCERDLIRAQKDKNGGHELRMNQEFY